MLYIVWIHLYDQAILNMDKFLKVRDKIAYYLPYYLPWGSNLWTIKTSDGSRKLVKFQSGNIYEPDGPEDLVFETNDDPKPLTELLSQVIDSGSIFMYVQEDIPDAYDQYYYIVKPGEVIKVTDEEYFEKYQDPAVDPEGPYDPDKFIEIDIKS
jgi:hypothetical protein